jgi:hypothetical protein
MQIRIFSIHNKQNPPNLIQLLGKKTKEQENLGTRETKNKKTKEQENQGTRKLRNKKTNQHEDQGTRKTRNKKTK